MNNFDASRFYEAIVTRNLFSVPIGNKKAVNEVQEDSQVQKEDLKTILPSTVRGRIWRNIQDSARSKVARLKATAEERLLLTGDPKKRISNKNILAHLRNTVASVSAKIEGDSVSLGKMEDDLNLLKATMVALRGFGADPEKCKTIEYEINLKLLSIASARCQEAEKQNQTATTYQELEKAAEAELQNAASAAPVASPISPKQEVEKEQPSKAAEPQAAVPPKPARVGPKDNRDLAVASEGMQRNLEKALDEHLLEVDQSVERLPSSSNPQYKDHFARRKAAEKGAFISRKELTEAQKSKAPAQPLTVSNHMDTNIGKSRDTNEDAEFVVDVNYKGEKAGVLAGVLDGHGGNEVARFVNVAFPMYFEKALEKANGNVRLAFDQAFKKTQKKIIKNNLPAGSTAVISYIDKATNKVYTATLGDSEAMICRKIDGKWKLIPLSVVRDWGSDKDAKRAEGLLTRDVYKGKNFFGQHSWKAEPVNAEAIKQSKMDPKDIRIQGATNVSRSFGDTAHYYKGRGTIQKEKVTECQLQPGDRLLLVCDGVIDYLPPNMIVEEVQKESSLTNLTANIIERSKARMTEYAGDNISVVALQFD